MAAADRQSSSEMQRVDINRIRKASLRQAMALAAVEVAGLGPSEQYSYGVGRTNDEYADSWQGLICRAPHRG